MFIISCESRNWQASVVATCSCSAVMKRPMCFWKSLVRTFWHRMGYRTKTHRNQCQRGRASEGREEKTSLSYHITYIMFQWSNVPVEPTNIWKILKGREISTIILLQEISGQPHKLSEDWGRIFHQFASGGAIQPASVLDGIPEIPGHCKRPWSWILLPRGATEPFGRHPLVQVLSGEWKESLPWHRITR